MEQVLLLTNAFAFCFAYLVGVKRFLSVQFYKKLVLLFLIYAVELLFKLYLKELSKLSFYINLIIIAFAINFVQNKKVLSFNYSVLYLCYQQIFVIVLSCLIYLIMPGLSIEHPVEYNLMMQFGIVLLSVFLNDRKWIQDAIPSGQLSATLFLVYNILFFVILNYYLPKLYPSIGGRLYYLTSLIFIIFEIFARVVFRTIDKKKIESYELQIMNIKNEDLEHYHSEIDHFKQKSIEFIKNVTNYSEQENNNDLKKYFLNQVAPSYLQFSRDKILALQIEQVESPTVRTLLLDFIDKISSYTIIVEFEIFENKVVSKKNKLLIYKAVSILLDDAYKDIKLLKRGGRATIRLNCAEELFVFFIISTTNYGESDEKNMTFSTKYNELVANLVNEKNIELQAVKDSGMFVQKIMVKNNE